MKLSRGVAIRMFDYRRSEQRTAPSLVRHLRHYDPVPPNFGRQHRCTKKNPPFGGFFCLSAAFLILEPKDRLAG